jgi:hypothetical protein
VFGFAISRLVTLSRVCGGHAFSELAKVLVGGFGGYNVLDPVVDFIKLQIDHAFFAQKLEPAVGGGSGNFRQHHHRFKDRDFLFLEPRRG